MESAVEHNPDEPLAYYNLISVYDKCKMFDQAEETLEQALELDPKSTVVYGFLGLCYARKGDFEEAERYYQIARDLDIPGINPMAWEGYKAVHEVLEPLRAAKTPIPPEVAKELEELKQSESTEK